jgi:hypothetical protein
MFTKRKLLTLLAGSYMIIELFLHFKHLVNYLNQKNRPAETLKYGTFTILDAYKILYNDIHKYSDKMRTHDREFSVIACNKTLEKNHIKNYDEIDSQNLVLLLELFYRKHVFLIDLDLLDIIEQKEFRSSVQSELIGFKEQNFVTFGILASNLIRFLKVLIFMFLIRFLLIASKIELSLKYGPGTATKIETF